MKRLSLVVIALALPLIASPLVSSAASSIWNTTISGAAGICDTPCEPNSNTYGFNDPNITIQYRAFVKNAVTGETIPPGGTVSCGTNLRLSFDRHMSPDIYWFATGGSFDSPYGDWANPDVAPPVQCLMKDYLSNNADITNAAIYYNHYVPFEVREPIKTLTGNNDHLSCGASDGFAQNCTASSEGSVPLVFNFAPTVGKFYSRIESFTNSARDWCGYINGSMTIKQGASWSPGYGPWDNFMSQPGATSDHVDLAAQSIAYPITVTKCSDDMTGKPNMPTVSDGGLCKAGSPFTLTITGSDPDNDPVRYGIDWDNNGGVDQWVPAAGYVPSGTSQTATRTYTTGGPKAVLVFAQDQGGNTSSGTPFTFVCAEPASSGDAGIDYSGGDIGGPPGSGPPNISLRVVPTLVRSGDPTHVIWTSENVTSCTTTGENGDHWDTLNSEPGGAMSSGITGLTRYTLTCQSSAGPLTAQAVVGIVPSTHEF